jgi:hypothetical protein
VGRHLLDGAIVYVAVQLVNGDVPIAVKIGFSCGQPFNKRPGEHRPRSFADDVVSFEGILGRVGRGKHDPLLALEFLKSVYLTASFGDATGWEGSTVAAVEYEYLLPRRAGLHGRVDLLRRQWP